MKYQVSAVSDIAGGKYLDAPIRLDTDDFDAARHEFLTGQAQGRPMCLRRSSDGAEWIEGPMSGRWIAPDGTEL